MATTKHWDEPQPHNSEERMFKTKDRVQYTGKGCDGVHTGRKGAIIAVVDGLAMVHWDDPVPEPLCFITHSNVPVEQLKAV